MQMKTNEKEIMIVLLWNNTLTKKHNMIKEIIEMKHNLWWKVNVTRNGEDEENPPQKSDTDIKVIPYMHRPRKSKRKNIIIMCKAMCHVINKAAVDKLF